MTLKTPKSPDKKRYKFLWHTAYSPGVSLSNHYLPLSLHKSRMVDTSVKLVRQILLFLKLSSKKWKILDILN
uniref:Ovule protein n=1 Tax=Strongyloides venezuelensis TaxID=75913 RepID=A0A0K0G5W0_STRVS